MTDFIHLVHRYFDVIARDHRMQCTQEFSALVRFENEAASLQVAYDFRRSYEVSVSIGAPLSDIGRETQFDLAEVLRFHGSPHADSIGLLHARETQDLHDLLPRLAALTTSHASRLLSGDREEFASLLTFRRKEAAEYAAVSKTRQALRNRASDAWERNDYAAVISAYRSMSAYLTSAERERLALAEKLTADKEPQ